MEFFEIHLLSPLSQIGSEHFSVERDEQLLYYVRTVRSAQAEKCNSMLRLRWFRSQLMPIVSAALEKRTRYVSYSVRRTHLPRRSNKFQDEAEQDEQQRAGRTIFDQTPTVVFCSADN